MNIEIRPITPEDATEIERLYIQSATHLRAVGDTGDFKFNAQIYLRDGFGDNPAFSGIVALVDDRLAGYLLYTLGYNTDKALRYLHVIDLAVDEALRKRGIGKALMNQAASICRERGGGELFWDVYIKNELALDFYRRLGATDVTDLCFMTWSV